jgi:hypothetical protein
VIASLSGHGRRDHATIRLLRLSPGIQLELKR